MGSFDYLSSLDQESVGLDDVTRFSEEARVFVLVYLEICLCSFAKVYKQIPFLLDYDHLLCLLVRTGTS